MQKKLIFCSHFLFSRTVDGEWEINWCQLTPIIKKNEQKKWLPWLQNSFSLFIFLDSYHSKSKLCHGVIFHLFWWIDSLWWSTFTTTIVCMLTGDFTSFTTSHVAVTRCDLGHSHLDHGELLLPPSCNLPKTADLHLQVQPCKVYFSYLQSLFVQVCEATSLWLRRWDGREICAFVAKSQKLISFWQLWIGFENFIKHNYLHSINSAQFRLGSGSLYSCLTMTLQSGLTKPNGGPKQHYCFSGPVFMLLVNLDWPN